MSNPHKTTATDYDMLFRVLFIIMALIMIFDFIYRLIKVLILPELKHER